MVGDERPDHAIILHYVGRDVQGATGFEGTIEVAHQRLGEHASLLMPRLPPRVGEVNMDRPEARRGDESCEEEPGIAGYDLDVGQLELGHPLGGPARVLPGHLDA